MIGGRFERQLPLFGEEGQEKIMGATVGVAGCGGLGVTLITLLAEAGVSHYILSDPDYPDITNLNRQFIYTAGDQRPKSQISAEWITAINPLAEIEVHPEPFGEGTESMFYPCDIIVDCLDNMESRMKLADYAYGNGKPLVHGGISGFEGQIAVSIPGQTPSLRDMIGTCAGEGEGVPVFGAAVSAIAAMEAIETLKIISGMGTETAGKLVAVDFRSMSMQTADFSGKR
ncbi:MAG: HesA/MoeB/ThiF family protein [Candidatus Methanomethylophilaceae archaeon]|nr:HesA/MoeB/ThiF family protein [Candidatus Methanomethylophilaceae archaeon]